MIAIKVENQRHSKPRHLVGMMSAATVNRRVASSNFARGANFLFLGIVQIAGHHCVRCERLESKEFVFLFHFSPYFNGPLWCKNAPDRLRALRESWQQRCVTRSNLVC
jgi:hypothetical protein